MSKPQDFGVKNKSILITGGAGFIGSHLAERLIGHNEITVFDNFTRNALKLTNLGKNKKLKVIRGDILNFSACLRACQQADLVIHCAGVAGIYSVGVNPLKTLEVNLLGTNNILRAAIRSKVRHFIEFSTSEVYGAEHYRACENSFLQIGPPGTSRWIYALSKLASEHLSIAHFLRGEIPVTVVRPFNVYGPRQVGEGAIRNIILRALKNQPITIFNDGNQIRSWCHIQDFTDCILRIIGRKKTFGQVFNIGNPMATCTIHSLALQIIEITGSRSRIEFRPHPGPEIDLRVPSTNKAEKLLGYRPSILLKEGLTQTCCWYREN